MSADSKSRYKAFVSYSHANEKWARWLTAAIEGYSIPRHIIGRDTAKGTVQKHVRPLFRDRDELGAKADLSAAVRKALASSDHLIVMCSLEAVPSRWVNEEIRSFIELHGRDNILCVIVSGDPAILDAEDGCFPTALFENLGDGKTFEPVAADLRPGTDGRRLAKLKIVAALLGVELSELIQRDAVRRQRAILGIAGVAAAAMAIMGYLAVAANQARDLAEDRRTQAEDLIEFMLTDLKAELQPVGRLDALDAVGQEVIKYYESQDPEDLTDNALGRRSRSFHMLGEVEQQQGNIERARELFVEAFQATEELLVRNPGDGQRIFDHAQSAFWVGELARQSGTYDITEEYYKLYDELARQLVQLDDNNPAWLQELAYAQNNLGIIYIQKQQRGDIALEYFRNGLAIRQDIVTRFPEYSMPIENIANSHAWIADALRYSGHMNDIRAQREAQDAIYESALSENPDNYYLRRRRLGVQLALANIETDTGHPELALARHIRNARAAEELIRRDPENMEWRRQAGLIYVSMAGIQTTLKDYCSVYTTLGRLAEIETRFHDAGLLSGRALVFFTIRPQIIRGRLALADGRYEEAKVIFEALASRATTENGDNDSSLNRAQQIYIRLRLADAITALGNHQSALDIWQDVIGQLEPDIENASIWMLHYLAEAYVGVGRLAEAKQITTGLLARGYFHPDLIAICKIRLQSLDFSCTAG
jgi:TIR domain/Tetratricopeptide repeat